ncbi:MAG TPA: zinc ribbon domain-containing protein, partial [Dehalococcoidia bacterium]|nr:zinc ribbon domain-containing protein [Dehalococcoidia bacterium]
KSPKRREKYNRTERLFVTKAIIDIVSDELYTGMVVWGRATKLQGHQPEEFRRHVPDLQIVSFEAFNRANVALEERRRVPNKSQGSPFIYSSLVRCLKCGSPTAGTRERHPGYNFPEGRRYTCRAYHDKGKTACTGWTVYEQTVTRAVIPFLADLMENKLHIRERLEEATRQMQWERRGDRAQQLEGELAIARRGLAKVQEGWETGIYTAKEARDKALEYRETIEWVEARLKDMESIHDVTADLGNALMLLNMPLAEFLAALPGEHLARICRAVFQRFTIQAWGHGRERKAEISAYQLTPAIQQALAEALHFDSHRLV